jgi:hypothetical protein
LSPRDVTAAATRDVIEREAIGIAERPARRHRRGVPARGAQQRRRRRAEPRAHHQSPGLHRGVRDMLAALEPIVEHAVDIVRGAPTDHSAGAPR